MFWVIQNNLFSEVNYNNLMIALERFDIAHTVVKVVPIFNILASHDFDSYSYNLPIDSSIEPFIDDSGLVMVCGSITLAKIGKERGWIPGSFLNDNFTFLKWREAYGKNLLNYESEIGELSKIKPKWDEFFIRPCEDTKEFSGMVMNRNQLYSSQNGIVIEGISYCNTDPIVMVSPIKEIYSEYRFFIVDSKVVAYSQYRLGDKIIQQSHVDKYIVDFAQQMVNIWQPARAFVIDIALTPDGLKIIEINNINSAGFYDCNIYKIVEAIENMTF